VIDPKASVKTTATETCYDLGKTENLRSALFSIQAELENDLVAPDEESAGVPGGIRPLRDTFFEWNAARDTRFALEDSRFGQVAHVFHLEWHGMRAAAGALPGLKLGIRSSRHFSSAEASAIINHLTSSGARSLVIHGFSPTMARLVQVLRKAGFDQIGLVWHGAPAMWISKEERDLFFSARRMLHAGIISRMHGMRRGTEQLIGKGAWIPQLLNVPPSYARTRSEARDSLRSAFAPSWNLIHKNLYTNVVAAATSENVDRVFLMTGEIQLPPAMARKLTSLPKLNQLQMLQMMEQCEIVLNASLVDCHPMVEMEALASGTPAIRGMLDLDVLEDHPYVKLTQVDNVLNAAAITKAIDRVLEMPHSEMGEIMDDYSRQLRQVSLDRYVEFCEPTE
jgi:hypothetical protein